MSYAASEGRWSPADLLGAPFEPCSRGPGGFGALAGGGLPFERATASAGAAADAHGMGDGLMRVLVTGGAGFIGSHLAEALLSRGDEVWVLDDLSTGRQANTASFSSNPRFHFVRGAVQDRGLLDPLVERVDEVYHLAASVGVGLVIGRPLQSILNNVLGAEAVLDAARWAGNRRVILFSSSEVYGKGNGKPLCESDDTTVGPSTVARWGYAAGKLVDEFLAIACHREHGLPVTVVRCFNTCGPRQISDYGMVIPRFIEQALDGAPITVYGDGKQTRCFSYVGDVVRGVLLLAGCPGADGEVFNIGTDQEVTILELAGRVRDMAGSVSRIEMVPYEKAYRGGFQDVPRRVPDLSKIGRIVGYRPEVGLAEMLERTIAHHRAARAAGPAAARERVRAQAAV
jgi:UDP-glucose 4-epimerase